MESNDTIRTLHEKLWDASELLDTCAQLIRAVDLNRQQNILRIAQSIQALTDIRLEIYRIRPDLAPDYYRSSTDTDPS